jgi:hypothetical protein
VITVLFQKHGVMENEVLFKLIGASSLLAIPTLVVAVYFQGLYIIGKGGRYGSLSDIFLAIILLLLIILAFGIYVSLDRAVGSWLLVVTCVSITGMIVSATGQFFQYSGFIKERASYIISSVGILTILAWMASIVVLTLFQKQLSQPIGWLTLISFILAISIVMALFLRKPIVIVISGCLLTINLVGWFAGLAWYFIML